MTMNQWRQNPSSLAEAVKLMATPAFQDMLAILKDLSPRREEGEGSDVYLGRIEGYREAIQNLLLLAEPVGQPFEPEPFYQEQP